MKNFGLGALELDEDGLFTFIDEAGAELLGFDSPQELIEKRFIWEFFDRKKSGEERKNLFKFFLDRVKNSDSFVDSSFIFSPPDGKDFWGVLRGVARVRDERSTFSGLLIKLTLEEEIYLSIFRYLPTAIFRVEGESKLVFINDTGAKELFGYSAEDLIGKEVWILHADPEFAKKLVSELLEILSERRVLRIGRVLLRRANGELFWATSLIKGIYDEEGRLAGREGILIETGPYEGSEDKASLFEYYRAFLGTLGHDIRSLASSVMGFLNLLEDTPLDDFQKELLQKALFASQHLTELLNNLLSSFKLQSGKVELIEVPFDLKDVLEDVAMLIHPRLKKGVELILKVSELPYLLIGDPHKLKQIILNLLSNSAKFTEEGFIELAVDELNEKENKVEILLHVRDTGPGIPESRKEEIFMPFSRLSSHYEGTGLGLYISKSMARLMGGDIWIGESDQGALFYIRLPFKKGDR